MGFLGNLFRNGANLVKNFVIPGIKGLIPKVINGGRNLFNHFNNLPQYINRAKDFYDDGKRIADNIINALPDSQVKDKLQDFSNKIDENVQRWTPKIDNAANTARDWGNAGNKILNIIQRTKTKTSIPTPTTYIPPQVKQQII